MPIRVRCTDCGAEYNLADRLAGKKIRCKKCESVLAVPAPEAADVAEAVVEPPAKKAAGAKAKTLPAAERDKEDAPRPKRRPNEEDDDDPRPRKGGRDRAARRRSYRWRGSSAGAPPCW